MQWKSDRQLQFTLFMRYFRFPFHGNGKSLSPFQQILITQIVKFKKFCQNAKTHVKLTVHNVCFSGQNPKSWNLTCVSFRYVNLRFVRKDRKTLQLHTVTVLSFPAAVKIYKKIFKNNYTDRPNFQKSLKPSKIKNSIEIVPTRIVATDPK